MAEECYAFIKDGKVINIAIFENPSEETLDSFKSLHNLDTIINTHNDHKAAINGTWDGTKFTLPQPYASWILDENNDWNPPYPYPMDGKLYSWNENNLSWELYTTDI